MAHCLRLKPLPMHTQCRSHGSRMTACRTRIHSCGARHTVSATTPHLWTTQMGRRGRSRNKTQSTEHRSGGKKGWDSGEEIDRVGLRSADQPASQPASESKGDEQAASGTKLQSAPRFSTTHPPPTCVLSPKSNDSRPKPWMQRWTCHAQKQKQKQKQRKHEHDAPEHLNTDGQYPIAHLPSLHLISHLLSPIIPSPHCAPSVQRPPPLRSTPKSMSLRVHKGEASEPASPSRPAGQTQEREEEVWKCRSNKNKNRINTETRTRTQRDKKKNRNRNQDQGLPRRVRVHGPSIDTIRQRHPLPLLLLLLNSTRPPWPHRPRPRIHSCTRVGSSRLGRRPARCHAHRQDPHLVPARVHHRHRVQQRAHLTYGPRPSFQHGRHGGGGGVCT